jgi:hypothetical protein
MNTTFAVVALFLIRILIPITFMVLLSYTIRKIEKRWQEKAAKAPKEIIDPDTSQDVKRPVHI